MNPYFEGVLIVVELATCRGPSALRRLNEQTWACG